MGCLPQNARMRPQLRAIMMFLSRIEWWALGIFLFGVFLRFWGINAGLPYTYPPDEPTIVNIVLHMLKEGDPNPHFVFYPGLMFDLNLVVYWFYYLLGHLLGFFASPIDLSPVEIVTMGVGRLRDPNLFLLSRGLGATFSAGTALLTYLIGRQLHPNKVVAVFAALWVAVSPTAVISSQVIAPDAFGFFFTVLSFLGAVRIADDPRLRNYVWAGIGAGLAIAGKYNAVFIVLPMVVAHFLHWRIAGWSRREIYIGFLATALAFLVTTPFALLEFHSLLQALNFDISVYAIGGKPGGEGNALSWYVAYLLNAEGLAVFLAVLQVFRIVFAHSKKGLVLITFPVVYFIFICLLLVRNARTIMLIVPFVALLAALFLVDLYEQAQRTQITRRAALAVFAIGGLLLAVPFQTTLASDLRLTQIDGREVARQWLESNLPTGTRVAEEAYSPYVDTARFVVQGVGAIPDHSPDWYLNNGFEYLVFSEGSYSHIFADPGRYGDWVNKYNQFFNRFQLVRRFDVNGYEIRIYKTGVVLPPHRVAARFGNYGEVIELVGYDVASSKWMPGEPLTIKLYWRTLADKNEPLAVALRLVDQNSREIGSMHGDLFQGKGWSEGIFETDWTIPTNTDAAPGAYFLNVSSIQTQYSYSLPVKTWAGDNIDQVALGPFKLSVLPPTATELQAVRQANIHFGDEITLLGYAGIGDALSGGSLPLTLYWRALAKPTRDYTVFMHLLDTDGKIVAQIDAQPRGGMYPTSIWDAGEIIRDEYALQLPADLAPGSYRIELGLYEYPSLTRLPAVDAKGNSLGDHWVLPDAIQVVQ